MTVRRCAGPARRGTPPAGRGSPSRRCVVQAGGAGRPPLLLPAVAGDADGGRVDELDPALGVEAVDAVGDVGQHPFVAGEARRELLLGRPHAQPTVRRGGSLQSGAQRRPRRRPRRCSRLGAAAARTCQAAASSAATASAARHPRWRPARPPCRRRGAASAAGAPTTSSPAPATPPRPARPPAGRRRGAAGARRHQRTSQQRAGPRRRARRWRTAAQPVAGQRTRTPAASAGTCSVPQRPAWVNSSQSTWVAAPTTSASSRPGRAPGRDDSRAAQTQRHAGRAAPAARRGDPASAGSASSACHTAQASPPSRRSTVTTASAVCVSHGQVDRQVVRQVGGDAADDERRRGQRCAAGTAAPPPRGSG